METAARAVSNRNRAGFDPITRKAICPAIATGRQL